jgi:hypothetical protein
VTDTELLQALAERDPGATVSARFAAAAALAERAAGAKAAERPSFDSDWPLADVAAECSRSVGWVRARIASGELVGFREGRGRNARTLVTGQSLARFLERRRFGSNLPAGVTSIRAGKMPKASEYTRARSAGAVKL